MVVEVIEHTEQALVNNQHTDQVIITARKILAEIMKYRRTPKINDLCEDINCIQCTSTYLPKIIDAVKVNLPVTFVLPGFPGKSPNLEKVLGHLPDYAEKTSLQFLQNLSKKIKKFYAKGIKIILCSDGRVFSDIVGMDEDHVSAYQAELARLIDGMYLIDISTFNLDHFYGDIDFIEMREELMKRYAQPINYLKNKVKQGAKPSSTLNEQESNRLYRGITRFLYEDAKYLGQTKSNTALQKESRYKAYEVIRRSNAWSQLIEDYFPEAIRLSIHPQICGAKKLGIRLIGNETWMTPWHGVALKHQNKITLLKRLEAEKLGAELIYTKEGYPSHYQLIEN